MYLENARAMFQGIMVLAFAAMTFWVDDALGLALVTLMGLMILQSAFTDFCPADLVLRSVGLKKKLEGRNP